MWRAEPPFFRLPDESCSLPTCSSAAAGSPPVGGPNLACDSYLGPTRLQQAPRDMLQSLGVLRRSLPRFLEGVVSSEESGVGSGAVATAQPFWSYLP